MHEALAYGTHFEYRDETNGTRRNAKCDRDCWLSSGMRLKIASMFIFKPMTFHCRKALNLSVSPNTQRNRKISTPLYNLL